MAVVGEGSTAVTVAAVTVVTAPVATAPVLPEGLSQAHADLTHAE